MDTTKLLVMATDCLRHFGLEQQGWTISWDNASKRLGRCNYTRKKITLSLPFASLESEDQMLDTVLHEIAHAIAPIGSHHGTAWQQCAAAVGAKPDRCAASAVQIPGRYQAKCKDCGTVYHKFRKRTRSSACRCSRGLPWSARPVLVYREVR